MLENILILKYTIFKFLLVLKTDYPDMHWAKLERFWLNGLTDWEPTSYIIISTFCKHVRHRPSYFEHIRILTRAVIDSWTINLNLDGICKCELKATKSRKKFFKPEILNALVDLVSNYDDVFQTIDQNKQIQLQLELIEEMNSIFIIINHKSD